MKAVAGKGKGCLANPGYRTRKHLEVPMVAAAVRAGSDAYHLCVKARAQLLGWCATRWFEVATAAL
jgi:hypothetical protein